MINKAFSNESICVNTFILAAEVLTKSVTSAVYYSEFSRQDTFKVLIHIMRLDLKNPVEYIHKNLVDEIEEVTFNEVETVFNLIYNFLNGTSNVNYSPFPFMSPLFEFDNKEAGTDTSVWKMKYSSLKFQIKKVIPFTIKFLSKYMQTKIIYSPEFAMTEKGEKLWTNSSLNTNTVKMPEIKKEALEKSGIITKEIWTTLFLAMPRLEFSKDFDVLYNSSGDGLSFNRLATHIVGYKGPVIILMKHIEADEESKDDQDAQEYIIGAYIDTEIKDKATF